MVNGKLVRLTPETIKLLEKARIGFETPNDCINRLCKLKDQQSQNDVNNETLKPYYDKFGNYYTYNNEDKDWTCHLDPKNVRAIDND